MTNIAIDTLIHKNEKDLIIPVHEAIQSGISYVKSLYKEDIGWYDFHTNSSGDSNSWVSSFIVWQLGEFFDKEFNSKLQSILPKYIHKNNGVGYSTATATDCDSTVHFVNAMLQLNPPYNSLDKQLTYILEHQNQDGGFSTYNDADIMGLRKNRNYSSYNGWLSSHICVSSAVFELLSLINFSNNKSFNLLETYLIDQQNDHGFWDSYWWHSRLFSTSKILNTIRLYKSGENHLKEPYKKGLRYLLNSYNENGFWQNGFDMNPCIISTCLASLVLLDNKDAKNSDDIVKAVANWILEQQADNGSWSSNPILQIPPTDLLNPFNYDWRFDKYGIGSCTKDQNNLYTTTLVLNYLIKFLNLK